MAFTKETANDPKSVDVVALAISNNTLNTAFKATASFQLKNAVGSIVKLVPYDVVLHLTATQTTQLKALLDALRTKATTELLP